MINIFLEAKNLKTPEAKFVEVLLRVIGASSTQYRVVPLGGKDTLEVSKNHFLQNTAEGGTNLIIFDADTQSNNGGYEKRKSELLTKIRELGINAELFLWPDDNRDGDVETLLDDIARHDLHNRFFGCFNDYECCLGNDYLHPNRKGKLYTYITSMHLTKRQRDAIGSGDWLFENPDYWNLDSPILEPIKSFLRRYL
ncbi:MAG: hypothetical protein K2N28_01625 [Muribaculaceae bacterium]|nr:hypothetical protein [Muribaculaceae bacterium]